MTLTMRIQLTRSSEPGSNSAWSALVCTIMVDCTGAGQLLAGALSTHSGTCRPQALCTKAGRVSAAARRAHRRC